MCGTPYLSQRISVLVAAAFWVPGAGADVQLARTRAATRTERYDERTRWAEERVMGSFPDSGVHEIGKKNSEPQAFRPTICRRLIESLDQPASVDLNYPLRREIVRVRGDVNVRK